MGPTLGALGDRSDKKGYYGVAGSSMPSGNPNACDSWFGGSPVWCERRTGKPCLFRAFPKHEEIGRIAGDHVEIHFHEFDNKLNAIEVYFEAPRQHSRKMTPTSILETDEMAISITAGFFSCPDENSSYNQPHFQAR